MRSVHLLGMGLLIGATALGGMLSVMTFRWQTETFPEQGPAAQRASAGAAALTGDATKGKAAFDAKCAGCHSIGGGKKTGPDLKGVTDQRPHDWLINFITAPDQVIASGDATAKQLVGEFGMPMPNLGVTKADAEDLLTYIASQSGGGGAAAPAPAAQPSTAQAAAPVQAAQPPAIGGQGSGAGQTLFTQKCAGCHTVGGGKLAGPDLKGVTDQRPQDWLVNFTTAPDKVIASGDATAKQLVAEYGMPMPNLGVSKADAEAILSYLAAQSGGGAAAGAAPHAAAPVLPPGSATTGHLLFAGEQRLSGGGAPCISCHDVAGIGALGGGNMGLDLTHANTKFGTAGVASILQSPPYPGMTEAFAGHQITTQEVADLTAFLAEVDTTQQGPSPSNTFPLAGLGAFALFLGLMQVGRRGRAQGVRRRLVEGRGR